MNSARLKAYFYLLLTSIIWGVASPVIKFTLGGIAALPFLTYRFGISSGVGLLTSLKYGLKLPKNFGVLALLIAYGLMTTTFSLGLLFFGLENTTVLESTLLTAIAPLLIAAAGAFYLKERVTGREKLGMTIAFAGTFLTAFEPLLVEGKQSTNLFGNILIIAYLVANTISSVWAKELVRKGVTELTMTSVSFIVGFVSLVPFTVMRYGAGFITLIVNLPLEYQLGVLYMALLSGSLAYTLWTKGQKTIEIGEAGMFSYLYPLFSAPLAVFWLKEKITPLFIVGGIVIAIGVIIAELKQSK